MHVSSPSLLLFAFWVCAALLTACTSPGYNDNPSQQMTTERTGCPVSTEFFTVYFSVHLQPYAETPDARITKERFRAYCEEIPGPGKVFFTADLVGPELRKTPIGIRIVDEEIADADENPADDLEDLPIVSEILPRTYPKGVIETQFELAQNGHYAVYLTRGGKDAKSDADMLRIPLHVGVGVRPLLPRILTLSGLAAGLALLGYFGFRYLRRRMLV